MLRILTTFLLILISISILSCSYFQLKPKVVYQAPPGYVIMEQKDFDELKTHAIKFGLDALYYKEKYNDCLNGG